MKKRYSKPELKTRPLQLGVFGDYNEGRGSITPATPASVIENLQLRME